MSDHDEQEESDRLITQPAVADSSKRGVQRTATYPAAMASHNGRPDIAEPTWFGPVFLVSVVVGLLGLVWYAMQVAKDVQSSPVADVEVFGQIEYIDPDQLESVIKQEFRQSFFSLPVDQVHQRIEQMPWVYRASLRKRWPDQLTVYVVEQQAVAWWNDDSLVNPYGSLFQPEPEPKQALVRLYGPEGAEQTALAGYVAMQELLNQRQKVITEVVLSERFAWRVLLNDGVELRLGRHQFIDRIRRFVAVLPRINSENKNVVYVDLRYDTGMAVGWEQ